MCIESWLPQRFLQVPVSDIALASDFNPLTGAWLHVCACVTVHVWLCVRADLLFVLPVALFHIHPHQSNMPPLLSSPPQHTHICTHTHMHTYTYLCAHTGKREPGYMLRTFKLEDTERGDITLSLRFVPYF